MIQIHGRLTPEVGVLLMRAIEAAGDALFQPKRWPEGCAQPDPEKTRREAAQRRADAIGLLAERALAAGFGTAAIEMEGDERSPERTEADRAGDVHDKEESRGGA